MKGTEKQISYANAIINKPIEAVNRYIAWLESRPVMISSEQAAVAPLRKAVLAYSSALESHTEFGDAAFVIEHCNAFRAAMLNCIRKAATDAGIEHSCLTRNIDRNI